MQLTERDRHIIRLIHRHRFLRSPQIVALIGGNAQPILRRLKLLYHHGYLERPRVQIDYYHNGGSRHIAYGLGSRGAAILKQEFGEFSPNVDWDEKNRIIGNIFLKHALFVSDVMAAIELACRQSGVRYLSEHELSFPNNEHLPLKWKVNIDKKLKIGVVPDRVFGFEFKDAGGNRERAYFFVEADRGTMPVIRNNLSQTSFFRKLLAYEATWSQSVHRERFGFHRFRVLTVTQSATRLKSLLEACSKLERGHGLFLFADKTVLENPNEIFSPVWRTGTGETAGLLD
jgi:hypothetical protein